MFIAAAAAAIIILFYYYALLDCDVHYILYDTSLSPPRMLTLYCPVMSRKSLR